MTFRSAFLLTLIALVVGFFVYRDTHRVARPIIPFECTGGPDCD